MITQNIQRNFIEYFLFQLEFYCILTLCNYVISVGFPTLLTLHERQLSSRGEGSLFFPQKEKGKNFFRQSVSLSLSLSLSAPLPISVREEVWRWGAKKPLVIPHFTFPPNISQSAEIKTHVFLLQQLFLTFYYMRPEY